MATTYELDIEKTKTTSSLDSNPYIVKENANINVDPYNIDKDYASTKTTENISVNTENNSPILGDLTSMFTNGDFVKGALIGAAATFLLTNKSAQEAIFKTVGKGTEFVQAGIEELKERYEDAQAEKEAENLGK